MAKRKKVSAAKAQQREETKKGGPRHKMRNSRKHGANTDAESRNGKSSPAPDSTVLTLGDRFRALPYELRAEIFACLVVQPVKWDMRHAPSCERLRGVDPFMDLHPKKGPDTTCVSLFLRSGLSAWRHNSLPVWVDPWRSEWAPEQTNPYVCTQCWDDWLRPRPFPVVRSLLCVCARRRNLQVLLVCRQWYDEAARVFYGRNTFAFGHLDEFNEFFGVLAPRWRAIVSKVSVLALAPKYVDPESSAKDIEEMEMSAQSLRKVWKTLQTLPGLSELELDAILLTREDCVKVLRGPALKTLRRLSFTQGVPSKKMEAPKEFVWPRRGPRIMIEDSDFATQMARAIKGSRYGWEKGNGKKLKKDVMEEKQRYCKRFVHTPNDKKKNSG